MKTPGFSYALWPVFVAGLVGSSVLSGCIRQHRNVVQTGVLSVRTDAPPFLRLFATVSAEPEMFVVSGTVEERLGMMLYMIGHVDIEVRGPDGVLLYAQDVPYRLNSGHRPKSPRATFRVRFSGVPPQGAVVTVRHHHGIHTE